jgi:phosphoribosylglycinamide formyltransferase-1
MRVLSAGFVERHAGRMVNIHPSLLPRHRGLDTHARALAAGDTAHGASVHWVTAELDDGPVIARAEVEVRPDDDAERLAARVLEQEHRLYPAALALLLADAVSPSHGIDQTSPPLVLDRDLDDRGRRIG